MQAKKRYKKSGATVALQKEAALQLSMKSEHGYAKYDMYICNKILYKEGKIH